MVTEDLSSRNAELAEDDETLADDKEQSVQETNPLPLWYRVSKSGVLIVVWIVMGMFNQINSTAMLDLQERVNVSQDSISHSLAVMNVGKAVGSIFGGILMDKLVLYDDAIMSIALFIATASVVMKPWSEYIVVLGLSFAIQGLMHGLINNAGNAMQIRMWRKKSNPPLFLMHMGYPIGMWLAPLIARPYLSSDTDRFGDNRTDTNQTTMSTIVPTLVSSIGSSDNSTMSNVSKIEIPYFIIGGCVLAMGLVFLVFFCLKPKTGERSEGSQQMSLANLLNPGSCAEGKHVFGVAMSCMLALFYFGLKNKDEPMNYYLFTFAVNGLKFSKQNAAVLDSTQGLGQAIGRLLSAIIRLCVPIQIMMMFYLFAILGTLIAFYYLVFEDVIYIWILTILFNTFSGPLWPGAIAWTDRYIKVTGLVIGVADIGNGIGGFVAQWIVGYVLSIDSVYIIYCSLGASAAMCGWLILMQVVASCNGDRYLRAKRAMGAQVNEALSEAVIYEKTTRL